MEQFEVSTILAAPAEEVWARVVTPEGVNDELRPFMRMTTPAAMRGKTVADVIPGSRLGRSWLLLFGVLPFDYDDIGVAELEDLRFLERSTTLSMRRWEHERVVVPRGTGCEVTDRIGFELRRGPWLHRLVARLLRRLFQHRHRRLARFFGPGP